VAVGEERGAWWVRALGPFLTAGAVVLVVVHLIWPHVRIDSVTLVLLAVALLPWLGPLFKSVELPGGWRFEFQEVKAKVETLADRVEKVESAVFVGFEPELEAKLQETTDRFHAYLKGIELVAGERPHVLRSDELHHNAHYRPASNEIVVAEDFAEDVDVVLDLYARHVLGASVPAGPAARSLDSLATGLADYLTCSFKGEPLLAPGAAEALDREDGRRGLRNLENDRTFAAEVVTESELFEQAEAWGGAFWELRKLFGRDLDPLLAEAWKKMDSAPGDAEPVRFVRRLAGLACDRSDDVLAVFARRGLELDGA
jgi:hypothetical protein